MSLRFLLYSNRNWHFSQSRDHLDPVPNSPAAVFLFPFRRPKEFKIFSGSNTDERFKSDSCGVAVWAVHRDRIRVKFRHETLGIRFDVHDSGYPSSNDVPGTLMARKGCRVQRTAVDSN